MHIAVTGNIGAGKTTLTQMLGAHYGWEILYEAVDNNPYLADFYEDMERWAFNLQIFFLNNRFAQAQKIRSTTYATIIQDRTIYEDAFVFARNLYESGIMTERDYRSYLLLFESMMKTVTQPDLVIYLKADIPKLLAQIKKRGRGFEADISETYLRNLNYYYEDLSKHYDYGQLITIDVNAMDFATRPEDFESIVRKVNQALNIK